MISNVDAKVTDYENKLQELKATFLEGLAVHTGITVVCMMDEVAHMGGSNLLRPQSNIHEHGIQLKSST